MTGICADREIGSCNEHVFLGTERYRVNRMAGICDRNSPDCEIGSYNEQVFLESGRY